MISRKLKTKKVVIFFIFCILVLIAGLRPIGLDDDSINYANLLSLGSSHINFQEKAPTFWLISKISDTFFSGSAVSFFLIYAFLGVLAKTYAIELVSDYPYFSMFLYLSLYYILHEMTQIRIGVAAGIFLLAMRDYFKGNMLSYLFKVFLATMFHYSAIISIFLIFLKRDRFNPVFYICALFLSIIFGAFVDINLFLKSIVFLLPDFLSVKLSLYMNLLEDGEYADINVFNFYYTSLVLLFVFFTINYKKIKKTFNLFMLKVFGVGLMCFYSFSFFPIIAFRFSEFFLTVNIVILANLSDIFRNKKIYFIFISIWAVVIFVTQGIMKNLHFGVLF